MRGRPRQAWLPRSSRRARRCAGRWAHRSPTRARRCGAALRSRTWGASGDRRLELGIALEGLEAARHRTGKAGCFRCFRADDEEVEPAPAFLVGWHAVRALEDRLLDAAVR